MRFNRNRTLVTAVAVGAVALSTTLAATVPSAFADTPGPGDTPPTIAEFLRQTMDRLAFQDVLDLAPVGSAAFAAADTPVDKELTESVRQALSAAAAASTAEPIFQQPQLDVSVLELDDSGRIASSGTVLMSPQYPHGVVVPVDSNYHTDAVRYREWDDEGWYTNQAQGTVDIVPGREDAPLDFMLPYPASVLKLMANFGVLRLVDQGVISMDETYNYQPTTVSSLCGAASKNTVRGYMDASLTVSSNNASCALIKLLWDHNALDALNQRFQDLGLDTLRLIGTNPDNGGRWTNSLTMSSLDTAKLLVLINGGAGTLWSAPDGTPVTRDELSASARAFFLSELGQQGWNWMLSTANYCGADYPAAGIPQTVADRWIAADGTVTVDGNHFGADVRPCNTAADVTFAHKPGWVSNTGSDAGIVHSLDGALPRHYVISVFSNLGDQYIDPQRPATPSGVVPVEYTQKFAQLGAAVDTFERIRNAD